MSVPLVINGSTFAFPTSRETNWGTSVTNWAQAVTTGMLQKAGGAFTLTADVDFGANFGLKVAYTSSRTANPASAGLHRLAVSDSIRWRNNANSADLTLAVDGSDRLTFGGAVVQGALAVSDTSTIDLTLASNTLSAAIQPTSVTNAHVAAAAAIARSKLAAGSAYRVVTNSATGVQEDAAAITAARVLISDANGIPTHSAVTSTELGYVAGVTSAVQTQLAARLPLTGGTLTGALTLSGGPTAALHAATKQYVDDNVLGLNAKEAVVAATTAAITLATDVEDGDTLDGVTLATGDRILVKNQASAPTNGVYVVAASGAPSRAADMDTWSEVVQAFVFVSGGSTNGNSSWTAPVASGGTIGVTDITWVQFGAAASYSADGSGIELSGTTFALELDGSTLSKSASGLKVADSGIANTQIAAAAAIARSKVATGTTNRLVYNDGSTGALADLTAITASRALVSDANGLPSASAATATELGYLSGVTSAIQDQFDNLSTDAASITYDNGASGLSADDVQDAIDELAATIAGGVGDVTLNTAQEFTAFKGSQESTPSISSGALTINCAASNYFEIALNQNVTSITLSNTGIPGPRTVKFTSSGSFTVTGWPGGTKWVSDSPYVATPSGVDFVTLYIDSSGVAHGMYASGFDT